MTFFGPAKKNVSPPPSSIVVSGYCYLFSCKSGNSAAFLHEEGENNTLFPHPTSQKKNQILSRFQEFSRSRKNWVGTQPCLAGFTHNGNRFFCLLFALVAVGRTKNAENKEGTLRTHKISRAKSLFRPKAHTAKPQNRRLLFLSGPPGPVPLPSGTGDFFLTNLPSHHYYTVDTSPNRSPGSGPATLASPPWAAPAAPRRSAGSLGRTSAGTAGRSQGGASARRGEKTDSTRDDITKFKSNR